MRGRGSFEGLAGYYAWTLDDGTTGRTTFWLNASGLYMVMSGSQPPNVILSRRGGEH